VTVCSTCQTILALHDGKKIDIEGRLLHVVIRRGRFAWGNKLSHVFLSSNCFGAALLLLGIFGLHTQFFLLPIFFFTTLLLLLMLQLLRFQLLL
jgi:hypothetical protein